MLNAPACLGRAVRKPVADNVAPTRRRPVHEPRRTDGSGRAQRSAIANEAEAGEAHQDHRPGRGLGDGGRKAGDGDRGTTHKYPIIGRERLAGEASFTIQVEKMSPSVSP